MDWTAGFESLDVVEARHAGRSYETARRLFLT